MWQVKNSEFLNEYSKIDFCKKNFSSWNSWVNSTKWNWTLLAFSSKQKSNNKLTNFLLFYLDLDTTKAIFLSFDLLKAFEVLKWPKLEFAKNKDFFSTLNPLPLWGQAQKLPFSEVNGMYETPIKAIVAQNQRKSNF